MQVVIWGKWSVCDTNDCQASLGVPYDDQSARKQFNWFTCAESWPLGPSQKASPTRSDPGLTSPSVRLIRITWSLSRSRSSSPFGPGPQTCQRVELVPLGAVRVTCPSMWSKCDRRNTDSWAAARVDLAVWLVFPLPSPRCMVSLVQDEQFVIKLCRLDTLANNKTKKKAYAQLRATKVPQHTRSQRLGRIRALTVLKTSSHFYSWRFMLPCDHIDAQQACVWLWGYQSTFSQS